MHIVPITINSRHGVHHTVHYTHMEQDSILHKFFLNEKNAYSFLGRLRDSGVCATMARGFLGIGYIVIHSPTTNYPLFATKKKDGINDAKHQK
jgi:hypothetical protein